VRSPYLDSEFLRTVYRAPTSASVPRDVRRELIAEGNPVLAQLATDRGISAGPRKAGSMLHRGWLDFTLKAEYAYDYGMPQWFARVDQHLSWLRPERLFLGRHRMFHFRVWYRDALASYLRAILLDSRSLSRPYLNPQEVQAVVSKHVRSQGNYTREIHKLLSLELVHRLFVDA
jgi:asparagine synthase (glutamine-hydrolysing)